MYDPFNDRVWVFSHRAPNATVIDAKDGSTAGTVDLGGAPEQAVSDGKGHVYVDLEDKDKIAVVNAKTLKVTGKRHIKVYRAKMREDGKKTTTSSGQRDFCGKCGSCLWLFDPEWPDLVHPFASAIDTPLTHAPERVHMMLDFKAPWCDVPRGKDDKHVRRYPKESLEDWHRRHGLLA